MTDVSKPIPVPDAWSQPFFDGAARGKLMLQRCLACNEWRAQARRRCDVCGAADSEWRETSGRASLISYAHVHQPYHPAFAEDLPYPIAVVELAEGPRILTNLVEIENVTLRAGLALTVVFEEAGAGIHIPKFRPKK